MIQQCNMMMLTKKHLLIRFMHAQFLSGYLHTMSLTQMNHFFLNKILFYFFFIHKKNKLKRIFHQDFYRLDDRYLDVDEWLL